MKVLTATGLQSGADDFCWTVEGEPVRISEPCDRDLAVRGTGDGGCGCSRAFSGLSSMKSTTTAVVRDLPLTRDDLFIALHSGLTAAGYVEAELTVEDLAEIQSEIDWLLELAAEHDVGVVLERDYDEIRPRSTA